MKIWFGPLTSICFCHTSVVLLVLQLINFPSHKVWIYLVLSGTATVLVFIVFCLRGVFKKSQIYVYTPFYILYIYFGINMLLC